MNKRVTLADIAADAGVSRSTASLVLRNEGRVPESTRNRVRASMDTLGYVYHRGAASLRASRTQSVGLIVPDMTNGFRAELTVGLESGLAEAGAVTLMANSFEDLNRQDLLVRSMLERQVDGLLVIPAVGTKLQFAEGLARAGLPVVVATRDIGHPKIPYVGIDNLTGGRIAAEHLIAHGCQEIAYLGGFALLPPRRDRIKGVQQVLRASKTGTRLKMELPGEPRGAWGLATVLKLIDNGDLPDGIVCHNDAVAFGVFRALKQRMPNASESIPIVSYDNVAEAALWEPPLTSVAASGHEVGLRCAEVLLRRIAGPDAPAERLLVAPSLVIRESCGCRPGVPLD